MFVAADGVVHGDVVCVVDGNADTVFGVVVVIYCVVVCVVISVWCVVVVDVGWL